MNFCIKSLDFTEESCYNSICVKCAPVAELADAPDLGSGGKTVGVQVPPGAPSILKLAVKFTVSFLFCF